MISKYKLKFILILIYIFTFFCLDNKISIKSLIKKIAKIFLNIFDTQKSSFKENIIKIETNSVFKLNLFNKDFQKSNKKYKSNHPEIIQVNNQGIITAIRPGRAIITVSSSNKKKTSIKVSSVVTNGLITNFTLDLYNASQYQNVMIVAHPDDEILWGGANLLKDKYFIVCLTNGYNLVRSNEFKKVLEFTKNNGIILNYPDIQDNIRDDWSEVNIGILKDITTVLNYKYWNKIVTYGKDGIYGHIHHIKTCEFVTRIAKTLNKYNYLYYFGKYYQKEQIPKNLTRINDTELKKKMEAILIYKSQKKGIYKYLFHSLPYENWVLIPKG